MVLLKWCALNSSDFLYSYSTWTQEVERTAITLIIRYQIVDRKAHRNGVGGRGQEWARREGRKSRAAQKGAGERAAVAREIGVSRRLAIMARENVSERVQVSSRQWRTWSTRRGFCSSVQLERGHSVRRTLQGVASTSPHAPPAGATSSRPASPASRSACSIGKATKLWVLGIASWGETVTTEKDVEAKERGVGFVCAGEVESDSFHK